MEVGAGPFILAAILLAVVVIGAEWWRTSHRRRVARAWAASHGWRFVDLDRSLARRWNGPPFGVGYGRNATEAMTTTVAGRPVTSFTYEYTTGGGKTRHVAQHHVVALALPVALPDLQLTPDGVGAAVARGLGGQDIDVESEAFNQRWRVQAADPKAAHDLVHPRLMERLLAPDARGMSIRVEGDHLLSWAPGAQDVTHIDRYVAVLSAVADHVPRFVWLDHGYDPPIT
ncbi:MULTISPECIES: hypothetical protein [unclassified Actinotalea]|uniref:hypothetical protein n=1 Tax=unclassified Actinotalea TaxID=2638618 RepID=UPI0015F653E7|nr:MULTISPECIES: hypothetical protein [unclassified Actinotalea]